MNEFHTIHTRTENDIFRIILNRQNKGNAINLQMIREITLAVQLAENNKKIRFIILSAYGNNFCTGADLEWMLYANRLTMEENQAECLELAKMYFSIYNSSKITSCIIDGACFGGGIGFVAACDYSFATSKSFFVLSEVKLGLIPAVISPYIVSRVGKRIARHWMLSGEKISSADALQSGLIDRLVSPDEIEKSEDTLFNMLRSNEFQAQYGIKSMLSGLDYSKIDHNLILTTAEILATTRTSELSRKKITDFFINRDINED